jgi:hypothetical protein
MSASAVRQVVQRSMTDEAFLVAFWRDPAQALAGYELTLAECTALLSGDQEGILEAAFEPLPHWWPRRAPRPPAMP